MLEVFGLDIFFFDRRKDLDFIDYLWNIFIQCILYSELEEVLKYVFVVFSNGEFYFMVYRKNNIVIVQLVREVCVGKFRMLNLVGGIYVIQLLVEIGLEKLLQDYVYVFFLIELVVLGNIEFFV